MSADPFKREPGKAMKDGGTGAGGLQLEGAAPGHGVQAVFRPHKRPRNRFSPQGPQNTALQSP